MRTVTLKQAGVSRYDDSSSFVVGDLELGFAGLPAQSGDLRFFGYMNSKKVCEATLTSANNSVTISADKLSAGYFEGYVAAYVDGKEIKRYRVERLIVTETGAALQADPELTALAEKDAELAETADTLKTHVSDSEERIEAAEEKIEAQAAEITALKEEATKTKKAFLNYVYRHYRKDYTDSDLDLSVADFCEAIGLDVSDLAETDLEEILEFYTGGKL